FRVGAKTFHAPNTFGPPHGSNPLKGEAMILQLFQSCVAWFKSDSDVIWFVAFWGFLVILGSLEIVIPAFKQAPERLHRWPTNFSLGILNAMILPLAPVTAVWGANWANDHGIGLL